MTPSELYTNLYNIHDKIILLSSVPYNKIFEKNDKNLISRFSLPNQIEINDPNNLITSYYKSLS